MHTHIVAHARTLFFPHCLYHVLSVSVAADSKFTGSHDTQVYTHAYWEKWHTQQCWYTRCHSSQIHHMTRTHLEWISMAWVCGCLRWKGIFYEHNVCRLVGVNDPIVLELSQCLHVCACTCVFLAVRKRHCSTQSPSFPNETCARRH